MAGRLALVIGSECTALGELGFTGKLAGGLYTSLRTEGGWQPATRTDGPLLDPTAAEFIAAVDEAFATAARRQATLLLGFIGHGVATGAEDFYLLARNSPANPNSHNAFHLAQAIRERLNAAADLDGLIVLVDACEAEQGALGAARRWTDLLALASGRMELLVASGSGPAYSGCFTRTALATFSTGLAPRGENLLPSDLVGPIAQHCVQQTPRHLSFNSGISTSGGDPGLWLVPNVSRRRDAVTGRPAAGFVDDLTRGVLLTDTVLTRLAEIVDAGGQRLRAVIGPAGSGKSTLMALLIRPGLVDDLVIAPEYVTAAVFLTVHSTIAAVGSELSAQLRDRLPGFTAAADIALAQADALRATFDEADSELDTFDVEVRQPLLRVARPGLRVTLVIDGLDQPEAGTRELLAAAISDITRRGEFAHVRVILGIREGTGVEESTAISHLHRIHLSAPNASEIADIVRKSAPGADDTTRTQWITALLERTTPGNHAARTVIGGWLVARLLTELGSDLPDAGLVIQVDLDTLVALRMHKALGDKFEILGATLDDEARTLGRLLSILVAAGAGPVLPIELLESALSQLDSPLTTARIRDLTARLGILITRSRPGNADESIGITHTDLLPGLAEQLHLLGHPETDGHRALAVAAMRDLADNDRVAEYARGSAVRHLLASGDSAAAITFLLALDSPRAADNRDQWAAAVPMFDDWQGSEHPDTLTARFNLARWRAESGDHSGAIAELDELIADRARILGPEHPSVLEHRHYRADLRNQFGSAGGE